MIENNKKLIYGFDVFSIIIFCIIIFIEAVLMCIIATRIDEIDDYEDEKSGVARYVHNIRVWYITFASIFFTLIVIVGGILIAVIYNFEFIGIVAASKLNKSKHAENNVIAMIVAIIFVLIPQILLVILFSKAQYNMGQEEIILNDDLNQGLMSKDTYDEYMSALTEVENYNIANLALGCVNIVIGILCIILSIYIINKKS